MNDNRITIGQWIGFFIFFVTCDGLPSAGFNGGTGWSLVGWLALSLIGGPLGGLLIARKHRFAGMVGGFIAGPLGLLGVYFYARHRQTVYIAETFIVTLVCSIPGLLVFLVLRVLTDAIFPPPKEEEARDDDDEDDRPRRRRRREIDDSDDEDVDEDDRPRRRSKRREIDDEDARPRRRRGRRHDNDKEDDEEDVLRRRRQEDDIDRD